MEERRRGRSPRRANLDAEEEAGVLRGHDSVLLVPSSGGGGSRLSRARTSPRNRSRTPSRMRVNTNVSTAQVTEVDWKMGTNAGAHHTAPYEEMGFVILRRGQAFDLGLTLNKPMSGDDAIRLEFDTGDSPQESKGTRGWILISSDYTVTDHFGWSGTHKAATGTNIQLSVKAPDYAPVGKYSLSLVSLDGNDRAAKSQAKETIVILFNPWSIGDMVFMASEPERQEYVMNEFGTMYVGSSNRIGSKPWNYAQFDKASLEVALYLLDHRELSDSARGDPIKVSRHLSGLVNTNDSDGGILVGRWTATFPANSTNPTAWIGSHEILEKFNARKSGVKYGQCWVFSGILTTICRSLGIPCRSISNFDSAHDTDKSNSNDFHFDQNDQFLANMSDSVWNFHVWNEVYMKRPDLPDGHDGWQVVDATPQERSVGKFQLGPTSLKAIKNGDVFLPYDTGFVFAEVNGDKLFWTKTDQGVFKLTNIDTLSIGKQTSTKAVGSNSRVQVTGSYKHPEGTAKERETVCRAFRYGTRKKYAPAVCEGSVAANSVSDEVKAEIEMINTSAMIGDPVEYEVILTNQTDKALVANTTVSTLATFYTGKPAGEIDHNVFASTIKPRSSIRKKFRVDGTKYLPVVRDRGGDVGIGLKMFAASRVDAVKRQFFAENTMDFDVPNLDIKVTPENPQVGEDVTVDMEFENPLEETIEGGSVRCTGLGPGAKVWTIKKPVEPGEKFKFQGKMKAERSGPRTVIAGFNSDLIAGVTGTKEVVVE